MTHPARLIPYADLTAGLVKEAANDNVNVRVSGDLRLYTYSKSCVYNRAWSPVTELARGLVLDHANDNVVATPFPKFFNLGERDVPLPALPFEVFEKLDGSLVIIFWHAGAWRTATKGSFDSEQARWAAQWLAAANLRPLQPGETYLAEYVGPDNKIVVHYDDAELVLLGAYRQDGVEYSYQELLALSLPLGWRVADRYHFDSIADLLATAGKLPATAEGFVVRFSDGYRVKVKGEEYCRLHRMVSNVVPLPIWEAMAAGTDLDAMRRELPEEFWCDFDSIRRLLERRLHTIVQGAQDRVDTYADWSDKELGLHLHRINANIRPFVFPLRKHGDLLAGKSRAALFRAIRPTANQLPGYVPSRGMQRVQEEAA